MTDAKRILCISLVYYFTEMVEKFLLAMQAEVARCDLVVVENPSDNSRQIREIIDRHMSGGLVRSHFIFDSNITFNAMQVVLDSGEIDFSAYDHVIITDGDLIPDPGWLDEVLDILGKHREVFCCGLGFHLDNKPERLSLKSIFPIAETDCGDYIDGRLGWWLKCFRRDDLLSFLAYRRRWNVLLHDQELYKFARQQLGRVTAKAKRSRAYHLTWDYVQPAYVRRKYAMGDPWNHDGYAGFVRRDPEGRATRFPCPWLPRHLEVDVKTLRIENYRERDANIVLTILGFDDPQHRIEVVVPALGQYKDLFCCIGALSLTCDTGEGTSLALHRLVAHDDHVLDIQILPNDLSAVRPLDLTAFSPIVPLGKPESAITKDDIFLHAANAPTAGGRLASDPVDLTEIERIALFLSVESPRSAPMVFSCAVMPETGDGRSAIESRVVLQGGESRVWYPAAGPSPGRHRIVLDTFPESGTDRSHGWCHIRRVLMFERP